MGHYLNFYLQNLETSESEMIEESLTKIYKVVNTVHLLLLDCTYSVGGDTCNYDEGSIST